MKAAQAAHNRSSARLSRRTAGTNPPRRAADPLADGTSSRDLGAAYRASGRTTSVMDVFGIHPYGEQLEPVTDRRARVRGRRSPSYPRLRQARRAPRPGVRRDGTARLDAADPLRRVRRRNDGFPRTVAPLYTGRRAGVDPSPIDRGRPRPPYLHPLALQTAFCQPNIRRHPSLPRVRRDRPRPGWQSGLLLREPDTPKSQP